MQGNFWTFHPTLQDPPRRYEGMKLNLLLPAFLPTGRSGGGAFYTTRIEQFCHATGAEIFIITMRYPDSYKLELEYDLDSGLNFYDLFILTGAWMPPLVERGRLHSITRFRQSVTDGSQAEWSDILPSLISSVSEYDGSEYVVPADGNVVVMVYRKDLLELHGLAKPESWEEWLAISSHFRDTVGPGAWTSSPTRTLADEGGYGACMVAGTGGHETLFAFLATFLQGNGTTQGIFFDPDTMDALLNISAVSDALLLYKDMMLHSSYSEHPTASDEATLIEDMQTGKCMMAMATVATLKVIASGSFNIDSSTIAVAAAPGSTLVLDSSTATLVDCNQRRDFCPHAVEVPTNENGQPPSNGETQWVNRAPYLAGGGFAWGISVFVSDTQKQQALWDLLITFVKQSDVVNVTATTEYDMDPFRQSTLDDMLEEGSFARDLFLQGGWQEEQLGSLVDTLQSVFRSRNSVLDLKIRDADKYLADTDHWMQYFYGGTRLVSEVQLEIAERWHSRTVSLGLTEQRNIYREVLHLPRYQEECLAGTELMAHECVDCKAGKFKADAGAAACQHCSVGRYQSATGQSECTSCETVLPGAHTSYLASTKQTDCVCPPDTYWSLPSENAPVSSASCAPCLDGLVCKGGLIDGQHRPPDQAAGYHATLPPYPGGVPASIVLCSSDGKCPEDRPLGECAEHSSGRACEVCDKGYYRSDDACVLCDGIWWNLTTIFCLAMGLITGCVMLYLYVRRGMGTDRQTTMTVVLAFGMTFSSVQALGAFQKLAVTWVEPLATLQKVFLLFTLQVDLIRPSCVFGVRSAVAQYLGLLAVYPCFAVALMLVCVFVRRKNKRLISWEQIVNTEGVVLMAGYLSVTVVCTVPFQCEENPDTTYSVRSYRSVRCWVTAEHKAMLVLSSLAVIVFVAGFMAMIAWATLQYPRRVARKGGTKFLRRYRFLFGRFNANHYYYALVYAFRNLVIALLPVVLVNYAQLQLLCMLLVIISTGCLQSVLWPWRSTAANGLDGVFTIGLSCVLTGGGMLLEDDDSGVLQIFLNTVFALVFGCSTLLVLVGFIRTARRARSYGIFLSHHKAGAAVLARWFKMVMQERVSSRIFLDSDDVDMLDKILDTTAYDCYNVVVLLTRNTLERIWCAGEIASAFKHGTNVVPIACDDFVGITDDFLNGLPSMWTAHQVSALSACGVSLTDINVAYTMLRRMSMIKLLRHASTESQERVVRIALRRCHNVGARFLPQFFGAASGTLSNLVFNLEDESGLVKVEPSASDSTAVTRASNGDGKFVILADPRDSEAMCIARILAIYIGRQLQQTVVIASSLKGQTVRRTQCLMVLLTRGVLESPGFASCVASFHDKLGVDVVPIHADDSFVYPTQDFWTQLSAGKVINPTELSTFGATIEQISAAYKALFNVLALKFTAHGSEMIQRTEVTVITMRLRHYASQYTTSNTTSWSLSNSVFGRFWRKSTTMLDLVPEKPAEEESAQQPASQPRESSVVPVAPSGQEAAQPPAPQPRPLCDAGEFGQCSGPVQPPSSTEGAGS